MPKTYEYKGFFLRYGDGIVYAFDTEDAILRFTPIFSAPTERLVLDWINKRVPSVVIPFEQPSKNITISGDNQTSQYLKQYALATRMVVCSVDNLVRQLLNLPPTLHKANDAKWLTNNYPKHVYVISQNVYDRLNKIRQDKGLPNLQLSEVIYDLIMQSEYGKTISKVLSKPTEIYQAGELEYSITPYGTIVAGYLSKIITSPVDLAKYDTSFKIKSGRFRWVARGESRVSHRLLKGKLMSYILDFLSNNLGYFTIQEIAVAIGLSFIQKSTMDELTAVLDSKSEVVQRVRAKDYVGQSLEELSKWHIRRAEEAKVKKEQKDAELKRLSQQGMSDAKRVYLDKQAQGLTTQQQAAREKRFHEKPEVIETIKPVVYSQEPVYEAPRYEPPPSKLDPRGIEGLKTMINSLDPFDARVLMVKYQARYTYGSIYGVNPQLVTAKLRAAEEQIQNLWNSKGYDQFGDFKEYLYEVGGSHFGHEVLVKNNGINGPKE